MKRSLILCCAFTIVAGALTQEEKRRDYVPDQTAVAIAEAVLIPVYGKKTVEGERPYTAVLKGDIWTVAGTGCPHDSRAEKEGLICAGGAATVEISKHDAHIVSMVHYK